MSQTKKQRKREIFAKLYDKIAGGENKSNYAKQLRATNRRVDKKKGKNL
jgi:hypothetical protein